MHKNKSTEDRLDYLEKEFKKLRRDVKKLLKKSGESNDTYNGMTTLNWNLYD